MPSEPEFPSLFEVDDDAPISIGLEEGEAQRRRSWESERPHRVNVPACSYSTNTAQDGSLAQGALSQMTQIVERSVEEGEGVYTSVQAALSEAFAIASGRPTVTSCHRSSSQKGAQMACSISSDDSEQLTKNPDERTTRGDPAQILFYLMSFTSLYCLQLHLANVMLVCPLIYSPSLSSPCSVESTSSVGGMLFKKLLRFRRKLHVEI